MAEKRKKLLVVCPYPENVAPSQRLKFEQYYSYFREAGYDITVRSFMSMGFWNTVYKKGSLFAKLLYTAGGYVRRFIDLFRIHRYDVVYIHLWVTPFGPPVFEWLYAKLSKRMIYDIDDLVYTSYEKGLLRLLKGKTKPILLMKKAGHVITCTPYLDEFVRKYNSQTTDISSTINSVTYKPVNNYNNDHKIVLGWSGSHSTAKFLYLLKDVLQDLAKEQSFKLLVMGDKQFNIEGVEVEAVEWSEAIEIPTLQRIDIGLYPLPIHDNWVMGKSGLKALQYMTLGIPSVAAAIGANFRVIENGVSGFLVTTDAEWKDKLRELISNPSLRKQIGMKARERAEKYFSVKANAPVYLSILENKGGNIKPPTPE